ncbi:hypothetical protein BUALT_Bualt02G0134300 [Buddleja alternifolia]|uniref:Protein-L-isoaspartate O-methyltransferase n=1 Tax=Buddleja alternifolia TaxID=168488 RepID=A0AAV6Y7W5_9LAMI|nr:hypothetical protein BUALT_Bualt02G0134300 [Buddleja alternifolia]
MPSTSLYSSLSLLIACRCRYRTPPQTSYLYFTPRHLHHHRLRATPPPPLAAAITAVSSRCLRLSSPHFGTGNCLFSSMEVMRRAFMSYLISTLFYVSQQRFWSGSGIRKNKEMVEHLQSYGVISSKKVAEVMETIDRALFVPEGTPPYVDSPMQIGYNATISAPHMHAMCLELLENHLKPGMHALDVGSGTGYLTACFAVMVGPQGRAVGVEHIPELVESSIKSIEKSAAAPLLKEGSLCVHAGVRILFIMKKVNSAHICINQCVRDFMVADGRLGWPEFAPYDAIHVGAAAPEIPPALVEQLKPGGRLVIPVGNTFQALQVVDKNTDGSLSVRTETSVRYVPLTSKEAQLRGY